MKKFFSITLINIIFSFSVIYAYSSAEHNSDLIYLFIDGYRQSNEILNIDRQCKELQIISASVYFTLDYCDTLGNKVKGERLSKYLFNNQIYVPNMDYDILTPGGNTHEKYTHMGWNYHNYTKSFGDIYQSKWLKRKKILIAAVNLIFDFSIIDEQRSLSSVEKELKKNYTQFLTIEKLNYKIGSKSDSLAAIFYYTHILGDIQNNSEITRNTRIYLDELKKNLKHHLIKVFGVIKYYKQVDLVSQINIKNYDNNINLEKKQAQALLISLQEAFPHLLENEKFYENTNLAAEVDKLM
ncbi:MAG: hypothetical protein EOL97_14175 [Spirochaetia bacterium]|nr:hypothetical protein [Spirochaetia bacterium]